MNSYLSFRDGGHYHVLQTLIIIRVFIERNPSAINAKEVHVFYYIHSLSILFKLIDYSFYKNEAQVNHN